MKILLDEQISGKVAERLRARGHDVTAGTDDPSLQGLSDPDLFEVAQEQGRALVTYNRIDFEPIIRKYAQVDREHHGLAIVDSLVELCAQRSGREALADAVHLLVRA